MIYNRDKLKQILPVKSNQPMDRVINGVMDSSILPEMFSFLYCFFVFLSYNGEKTAKMRKRKQVAVNDGACKVNVSCLNSRN